MDVKTSMSRNLITIGISASLDDADKLMSRNSIRHLPVVNEAGTVVGILSNRDVRRARNPGQMRPPQNGEAHEFMSWPVITVHENTLLREAALGMLNEKISALLVTDDTKTVVGIITSEDMLLKLIELLPQPSALDRVAYSPLVGEFLREVQSSGI